MPDADLVLVIDDEPQIRRAVRDALRDVASRVDEAGNGWAGVDAAANNHPDLVVLDLGLPDMAGVDVCREIRQRSAVPIIVLSARHSEHEKVDLLNAGADDYVTKPFSVLELAARAKAHIRRGRSLAAATGSAAPVALGGLLIDTVESQGVARRNAAASHADRVADSRRRCCRRPAKRSHTSRSSTRCGVASSAARNNTCACTSRICVERSRSIRPRRRSSSPSRASAIARSCRADR